MNFGMRLNLAIRALVGAFPNIRPDTAGGLLGGVALSESPKRGAKDFLEAYSTMPWLRATTHRISESVASTRWHVFAMRRSNRFVQPTELRNLAPDVRHKAVKELKQTGELIEIEDTPLRRVLLNGNPVLLGSSVRRVTQIYIDILGEAFWLKERNGTGAPESVWPLSPVWIKETPTVGRPFYLMEFGHFSRLIPDTEMLWFRDPDPVNPYGRGSGVARSLSDELETDEYAAKHIKSWFYNSAVPVAIISPTENGKEWSDTARRQMKLSWMHEHQGFWRSFKMHFAKTPLEVTPLSHTFQEQQLGELRRQERDTIVQVLGIPPELVGIIENSNRATIESADFLFAKYVLIPRLELLRETLQERLIPEYDERLILDYDDPVPEDREFKLQIARSQPQALMQNEWREWIGLDPVEGGDVHHVPTDIVPATRLDQVIQPQRAVATLTRSASSALKEPDFVDVAPDDEFYLLVHRVADRLTPAVQRRFIEAINAMKGDVSLDALTDALRSRVSAASIEDVIPFASFVEAFREASSRTFEEVIVAAGNETATELNGQFGVSIGFNEANPQVAEFARSHAAIMVSQIDDTTRQAIRQAIARVFEENRTAQQAAREIRDAIGLLPRQETALENFRQMLLGQGRSVEEIQRRVERQAASMLRRRSRLIARTELIDVASEGQFQLWNQAADQSVINSQEFRRFWVTTPDDRLDINICEPIPFLNPRGVGLREPFVTPAGPKMRPTAHPQCRCAVTLRKIQA